VFEWQRIDNNIRCHCEHNQNSHLENTDICLNGLCICEKFGVDKKVEVVISPKAIAMKNLPEKFATHFDRNKSL
jgi:hypothetical protein